MNRRSFQTTDSFSNRDIRLLAPVFIIGLLLVFLTVTFLVLDDDAANPFKEMYLLPWVLLLGIVLAAPSVYLIYKRKFDLFNPLVYAAWSYFIPAFFFGGLILAGNFSQPFFLSFIEDERYNLPLTFVYIALGYAGLTIGFFLPIGKRFGEAVSRRLPVWDWSPDRVLVPALVILVIGLINTILGFLFGFLGYQKVDIIGAYDGLVYLLSLFWMESSLFLWMAVFRKKDLNLRYYQIIGILIGTSLIKSAFQGNRGSLFQVFIIIAASFILAERVAKFKQTAAGVFFLGIAITVGMIYGTTFRNIKQTEAQIGMGEYTEYVLTALEKITEQNPAETLAVGFTALAERIEAVSSLAVVVSNYEKLQPYEESYGIDNNIWKDTATFLIPRPLWNDKPVASEPRKYADLYFNYSENSFTVTPMGDLLRNFGPVGVPLGMIFLGVIIRFLYAGLYENQAFSFWRRTLYLMLLINISYEGFYGSIIPYLVRIGFISIVGILIMRFLIQRERGAKTVWAE